MTVFAAVLAGLLWLGVGADVLGPGPIGRYSGFIKGNDFVQFYVVGRLAVRGDFEALVDGARLREAQAQFLPTGSGAGYPPVYGPAVALLMTPLARLSYVPAYYVWSGVTLAAIATCTLLLVSLAPTLRAQRGRSLLMAAAYMPVAFLVLDGQISALGCAALALAARALSRRSTLLAGIAIGCLAYKVSLWVPALVICAAAGAWRVTAIAAGTGAVVVTLPAIVVGPEIVARYIGNTMRFAAEPELLTRNTFLMASLRTFWQPILPAHAAVGAYAITSALTAVLAGAGWRRSPDALTRTAFLGLGIVLTSPHLFLYDLVLLLPAFVASASRLAVGSDRTLRIVTAWAYLAPLSVPLAIDTGVQPVTLSLAAWLWALWRSVTRRTVPLPTLSGSAGQR